MKKLISIQTITAILLIAWAGAGKATSNPASQVVLPLQLSAPESKTDDFIALNQICTNSDAGYQISYPQDWQTNSGETLARCQVFDPGSARVPEYTESMDKAIYLWVENKIPFDSIAKEDISEQHLSTQTTAIAGKQAVIIESKSTGAALLPPGVRKYSYIIDLGNKTLIATTYDLPGNNYRQNQQILARMMETIEFSQQLITNNQ